MNCRNFEIEFDPRKELGADASIHLDSCVECQEHANLLGMLSGLERVGVPKDFDFHLTARIKRGKPDKSQKRLFPSLQFVMPMIAIIFVVSIAALTGLYFMNSAAIKPVAINEVAAPTDLPGNVLPKPDLLAGQDESPVSDSAIKNLPIPQSDLPEILKATQNAERKPKTAPKVVEKDIGGGSRDLAGTSRPAIIQPEFDSNRRIDSAVNPNGATTTKLSEVWKLIGISVDSFRVTSVDRNSVAERSGIKVGDVVEALDGTKLSSEIITGDQISVKSLTVVRNGLKQEISLINR